MPTLEEAIDLLGAELVKCNDSCAGIWRDQRAGILPRCLILERPESRGRGCLAAGLNPGASKHEERAFYLANGIEYDSLKSYWTSAVCNIPYYVKARRIIDQLGLDGPIVWSDLAKCENTSGVKGLPPLQTLRHCTRRFLRRELDVTPQSWPVLGIGWEAYRALAYLVPERAVIGIPHPTGAYGAFAQLSENRALRDEIRSRAEIVLRGDEPGAIWLGRGREGS
jgi:hypothetical protein